MKLKQWAVTLLVVAIVAFAWQQVFVMTGILWWNAPEPDRELEPPEPVDFGEVDTSWVNLETWQRTHPVWPALR